MKVIVQAEVHLRQQSIYLKAPLAKMEKAILTGSDKKSKLFFPLIKRVLSYLEETII